VLNKLGIQTASFIAILSAAGLSVGLALQGFRQILEPVFCLLFLDHLLSEMFAYTTINNWLRG